LGHLLGLQTHDVGGQLAGVEGGHNPPPARYAALRFTRDIAKDMVFTIEPGIYFIPQLLDELRAFNPEMLYKPRIVALSKIDLLPEAERRRLGARARASFAEEVDVFPISAVAQMGLEELKHALWKRVRHERTAQTELKA
ncbi:MAG: M24 family metallopeptidase, partial [Rhodothermales bacterium]